MSQLNEYNREIRVFLSSTFKDMDEERRYLVEQVFPLVRLACAQRQVVFTEIDLRWGITELEAKNGRTVEICLEEIDRSRNSPPFFIGFLGERYGWIPTHDDLKKYLDGHDSPYADKIAQALEQGISVTELEMQHAFLNQQVDKAHARIFLRSRVLTEQLYDAQLGNVKPGDFYDAADGKLDTLKAKLRSLEHGVMGLDGYQTVAEFGEAVKNFLMDSLERLYPDEPRSALQTYLDSQAIYAQSRLSGYVPLVGFTQKVIEALKRTKADNQMRHVHLYGESGLGKSAFLAYLQTQLPIQMGAQVLAHFVGAETSATPEGWRDQLMARLRHQLAQIQTVDKQNEFEQALNIAGEEKDTWDAFYDLLAKYQQAIKQPAILLLDAINQMHGVSRLFEKFNPINLPHDVFLVTSAIEEYPLQLTQNTPLPKLDSDLIRNITHSYLADYQKTLPPEVVTLLANAEPCKNSLFLKMLLEELRLLGRHETLLEQAQAMIGLKTPAKLFEQTLQDIDTYAAQNGVAVQPAKKIMQFIQLSYRGLTQHQLKQLLSQSTGFTLHDAHLSPVLARLRNFLLLEEGRFRVMHTAFVMDDNTDEQHHRQLIANNCDVRTTNGVLEKVYQTMQLNLVEQTTSLLCEHLWAVFMNDELLCRDALYLIGAGEAKPTSDVSKVIDVIEIEFSSWEGSAEYLDFLGLFFIRSNFLALAEAVLNICIESDRLSVIMIGNNWRLASTLHNLAQLYQSQGNLIKAEALLHESLEIRNEVLPKDHPDIAASLNNLAMIYHAQNRLKEAELLCKQALVIYQAVLPKEHPDIAASLNNLAMLYHSQNRLKEAELLYKQALVIYQAVLPKEHPDIAASLNNLARVYQAQNRLKEAEQLYKQALSIVQAASTIGHPHIATSLNNLAGLYQAQSDMEEAEQLYKKALVMRQIALPIGHPDIAVSLNNLARVYQAQNRLDEAEQLYQQALIMVQKYLPTGHSTIATCLNNLAALYQDLNRLDEAAQLYQQSLEIYQVALPEGHSDLATSLNNLAVLFEAQNRFEEAEPLYQQALEIYQVTLPEGHPGIATGLNNLAALYQTQNRFEEAELLYQRALEIRQAALREGHLDIAISLNNLATLYHAKNCLEDAEPLYKQALIIFQESLPADHPDIAASLNNLARLYHFQNRLQEAEPLYLKALNIYQITLPEGHPAILESLNSLAMFYHAQNRFQDAEKLFQQALSIYFKTLPAGHPLIISSLKNLAVLCEIQSKFDKAEKLYVELLRLKLSCNMPREAIIKILDSMYWMYNSAGYDDAEKRVQNVLKLVVQELNMN